MLHCIACRRNRRVRQIRVGDPPAQAPTHAQTVVYKVAQRLASKSKSTGWFRLFRFFYIKYCSNCPHSVRVCVIARVNQLSLQVRHTLCLDFSRPQTRKMASQKERKKNGAPPRSAHAPCSLSTDDSHGHAIYVSGGKGGKYE